MKTIDIVCVDYGLVENTKLLVKSIETTVDTKKYDYIINLVWQYDNSKEDLMRDLREKNLISEFGDNEKVRLIEGVDQSDKRVTTKSEDGNILAWPSTYGYQGYQKGTLAGNSEYICYVDTDSFFLSKNWTDLFTEYADKYFFVSSRFDSGNHFKTKHHDLGMAWGHLFMIQRKHIIEYDILPDLSWRDDFGNFTKFANDNDLKYMIFPMSAGTKYRRTCTNHKLNDEIENGDRWKLLRHEINGDFCLNPKNENEILNFHQYQGQFKYGDIGRIKKWYDEYLSKNS
tara:strand:- start:2917 stop:3774 length:858 start_codon:yes stop_codon:yes gene_type:complete